MPDGPLEGGLIFYEPDELLPIEIERLAQEINTLFGETLPLLHEKHEIMARPRTLEHIQMIINLLEIILKVRAKCSGNTEIRVTSMLTNALGSVGIEAVQNPDLLTGVDGFFQQFKFQDNLQTGEQIARILRTLAKDVDETGASDLTALHADLDGIWGRPR